jgi:hypothetical protein
MSNPQNYSVPESSPIATNEPAIIDLIIAEIQTIKNLGEVNHAILIPHLLDRKAFGVEKYGTPLQASNDRDHRTDAFQEALDLIAYLKQGVERGDHDMRVLYYHAIVLATELAELMEGGSFNYDIKKKTVTNPQ